LLLAILTFLVIFFETQETVMMIVPLYDMKNLVVTLTFFFFLLSCYVLLRNENTVKLLLFMMIMLEEKKGFFMIIFNIWRTDACRFVGCWIGYSKIHFSAHTCFYSYGFFICIYLL